MDNGTGSQGYSTVGLTKEQVAHIKSDPIVDVICTICEERNSAY